MIKAWLLDVDYVTEHGRAVIRLWCKDDKGVFVAYDKNFLPYFYVLGCEKKEVEGIKVKTKNEIIAPLKVEEVKVKSLGRDTEALKVYTKHPQHVPKLREEIKKFAEVREADIPFAYRYLIDKDLACMDGIIIYPSSEKVGVMRSYIVKDVKRDERHGFPDLKILAFDCEMLSKFGMPNAEEDPIVTIGVKTDEFEEVIHGDEKDILKRFIKIIKDYDPDIIVGYNQDSFDWPYIKKRAEKYGIKIDIGRDRSEIEFRGGRPKIAGRLNVDLYDIALKMTDVKIKTLKNVAEYLGRKIDEEDIEGKDIYKYWASGQKDKVFRHVRNDVINTYFIAEELLPMHYELSKMIRLPLDDVTRIGRGKQVDYLLLSEAHKINEVAPNPREIEESYEGAFVLEPARGLHENVVCLDFACHPEDTYVIVKGKGPLKISDVREGDYVLGRNGWFRVEKVWVYDYDGILIDINGLKCTPNHRLPVFNGKLVDRTAYEIAMGFNGFLIRCDFKNDSNGYCRLEKIGKVSTCYYRGKVYDLTLEGDHYYFANGILTHNSMYPSIMIAFNISPDTFTKSCDDCFIAPEVGHKFKKHPDGFFKRILKMLIEKRREIKKKLKKLDPASQEYKLLDIKQTTLKILTNSFYGYTGWNLARWYCKECAEATTAWGRHFIKRAIEIAKKFGFDVLYGDSVAGDTLVYTNMGAESVERLFERVDVRIGDREYYVPSDLKVLTLENGRISFKPVRYVMRHRVDKRMFRIWISDNRYIDVTEDHSLIGYNGRFFKVKPVNLEGFRLIYMDGSVCKPVKPIRIEEIEYEGFVYDLEVDGTHTFFGNNILLHNTDSLFVTKDKLNLDDIKTEIEKLIEILSKDMPIQLEVDEYYKTIFFVEKKRYAGLTRDGRLVIKGLEVRRGDWCELAKRIQKDVIEIILKEKNPEKALEFVKNVIDEIKGGRIKLEDYIIYKSLTKKPSKYESKQAHVRAAMRAMEMGIHYPIGSKIGFVVLRGSGSIGDRAYPIELIEEFDGEYVYIKTFSGRERRKIDKDYYIDHQVIPSVLRILERFGYTESSIKGVRQRTLFDFT